jgi:ferritin-like metal-binding protein YciE
MNSESLPSMPASQPLGATLSLVGLIADEAASYRYLLLICELAGLDDARYCLETNLSNVEAMADWLRRHLETFAVRHLQSVGVLSSP